MVASSGLIPDGKLHLGLRPSQREQTLEGRSVAVFVSQVEHLTARRRSERPKRDVSSRPRRGLSDGED